MALDSHADTIVLGSNAIVLNYTTRECDLSPFADSNKTIRNVQVVTGATAITNSTNGKSFILVFHEAI
jgi:hypothetical protein